MKTYRHALILGLARSGVAAARLLRREGTRVTVLDQNAKAGEGPLACELREAGVHVCVGVDTPPSGDYDVCIVSPGWALTSAAVRAAQAARLPLVSELELGWSRLHCPTVAVTGSNGKSTMVKWASESFVAAGLSCVPAGNYGTPVSEVAMEVPGPARVVLEVSSFQLETVQTFSPEVAVVLNLLPNHFDRHGDMEHYLAAKARIYASARPETVCLAPWRWADRLRSESGGAGDWQTFGVEPDATWRADQGRVYRAGEPVADLRDTLFGQASMGAAAAATVGALHAMGVASEPIEHAARHFVRLPHRVEEVAVLRGVRYINDSKSTNLAAVAHALDSLSGRVRLIAGGLAKEADFESIKERLCDKVIGVYLIGNAAEAMASAWSCCVPCEIVGNLSNAVQHAQRDARDGETVLFSPGCASFDQFRNYEQRGIQYAGLVKGLAEEKSI